MTKKELKALFYRIMKGIFDVKETLVLLIELDCFYKKVSPNFNNVIEECEQIETKYEEVSKSNPKVLFNLESLVEFWEKKIKTPTYILVRQIHEKKSKKLQAHPNVILFVRSKAGSH